jgi:hypothetical protein
MDSSNVFCSSGVKFPFVFSFNITRISITDFAASISFFSPRSPKWYRAVVTRFSTYREKSAEIGSSLMAPLVEESFKPYVVLFLVLIHHSLLFAGKGERVTMCNLYITRGNTKMCSSRYLW